MALDSKPLLKILKLEHEKGYRDAAVIGGLDRFLKSWAVEAAVAIASPRELTRFKQLVINAGYASLSEEERRKWMRELVGFLKELEQPEPAPAKPESPPVKKRAARPRTPKPATMPARSLDQPVTAVKGISDTLAKKFNKLGVWTVRDLLYFFPHRHLDYSQLKHVSDLNTGEEETIVANVWQAQETRPGGRRSTEAIVGDETGNIRVVWFNNPYLARQLKTNSRIVLSGRVGEFHGRQLFQSPEWELLEGEELVHTGRLVPVYPLTEGLHPRQVRRIMKPFVTDWAGAVEDFLPAEIRRKNGLLELAPAIAQAHYPDSEELKDRARLRLAFDELFLLQLGVLAKKRDWQESQPGTPLDFKKEIIDTFLKSLPFTLTAAQQKALNEILADLRKPKAMSRLLQGEVGSGKTVVATACLLAAVASGFQGAIMAPTEILAEQHFATLRKLLGRLGESEEREDHIYCFSGLLPRPITVALLIGQITPKRKLKLQSFIEDGSVDIVIGTHALIQKGVEFKRLGLIVIDEQHRFGVAQRSTLRQKGFNPHVLVMTATPIPRTLALTLYGDLDLSVISELPPGRQEIKTKWLKPNQRESAYAFIRKQVAEGRQAFIICPLVEESEAIEAKAATAEYEHLSWEVFPDLKLGLIHGRLASQDKDDAMQRFHSGEFNILVSTPVVEVGIDVPNATVMLVESADRFGLSQLHQFRGRVGRGEHQSFCMLLADNPSQVGRERLDIIEKTRDGFELAEADLKLRGPGEFFGTRQSGLPDLKMAKLSDVAILELARNEAVKLFEVDPKLKKPEHEALVKELARVWSKEAGEWS